MKLLRYQNLNDGTNRGQTAGSAFWNGRFWAFGYDALSGEWLFGRKSRNFSIGLSVGGGDSDRDISVHFGLPWLFTFYFTIGKAMPRGCKHREFNFYYFENAIWLRIWGHPNESNRGDQWWKKIHVAHMPWDYWHLRYEVLDDQQKPIYTEQERAFWQSLLGTHPRRDAFETMRAKDAAALTVAKTYTYHYKLKNGTTQIVNATIHAERLTWGWRWFPFIQKHSTSIDVKFNREVGEGTGSWKGGCVGCGWDLLPNETPLECLRRMEATREFYR